jgi:hypothetical protein
LKDSKKKNNNVGYVVLDEEEGEIREPTQGKSIIDLEDGEVIDVDMEIVENTTNTSKRKKKKNGKLKNKNSATPTKKSASSILNENELGLPSERQDTESTSLKRTFPQWSDASEGRYEPTAGNGVWAKLTPILKKRKEEKK